MEVSGGVRWSGCRSAKRKMIDTTTGGGGEDEETSAHKVGWMDDLLIKILLELPLRSLCQSKSVCKRWLSLINDPRFTLLRNAKVEHPSGLFIQLKTSLSEFAFVPLGIQIQQSPPLLITTTFPFYPPNCGRGYIEVLQACNGLLLCSLWPDKYYVYNPTLNSFKLLPLPNLWGLKRLVSAMAIAFDPKLSPHYKVIYFYDDYDPTIPTNDPVLVRLEIYSSQTGNWTICNHNTGFNFFTSFNAFERGIYWNHAIHWIDYSDEVFHFNIQDIHNPYFKPVQTPRITSSIRGKAYKYDKLLVSGECLLLVQMASLEPVAAMNVYQMNNDYSGWSIKYHLNLLDHIGPSSFRVLSIVLGEGDDHPFMLLELPPGKKLTQYNLNSKTCHDICDLATIHPRDSKLSTFLFTPSLAAV